MNYLGLDYGAKHVGVAIAEGPLAKPLMTLSTDKVLNQIAKIVSDYQIAEIIIGQVEEVFLKKLQETGIPVRVVDETLSSHDARQALMHTSMKKRHENEHEVAAAIMLQRWLDEKNN